MRTLIILIPLLFIFFAADAQNKLLLKKKGGKKYYLYSQGDYLKIQTETYVLGGELQAILDSTIVIKQKEIPLRLIEKVLISRNLVRNIGKQSVPIGIGYIALSSFNHLINNESPLIDAQSAYISGGLVFLGVLLKRMPDKKLKINKNWRFEILDYEILQSFQ